MSRNINLQDLKFTMQLNTTTYGRALNCWIFGQRLEDIEAYPTMLIIEVDKKIRQTVMYVTWYVWVKLYLSIYYLWSLVSLLTGEANRPNGHNFGIAHLKRKENI